jgi:hypothetical protein
MTANWLTFQSLQRSQEVLQAINTLSIHLTLTLDGIADEERSQAADHSVETLRSFLDELAAAATQVEQSEPAPILGVDPRLQQLAQDYLAARRRQRFRSCLRAAPIDSIKTLLTSRDRRDWKALLECLAELRVLVEEHMHDDASKILGVTL